MSPVSDVRNHIRARRRRLDLTQQELADRVGVTRQTIVSIEKGRYNPSVGLAILLSRELEATVESLFEVEPEEVERHD